jgi:hypothetical protein
MIVDDANRVLFRKYGECLHGGEKCIEESCGSRESRGEFAKLVEKNRRENPGRDFCARRVEARRMHRSRGIEQAAMRFSFARYLLAALALFLTTSRLPTTAAESKGPARLIERKGWAAPEANQAAAADAHFVYAIDSTRIAKYDRQTGERVALSAGPAHHLNSGFFLADKLYCAHSNYPRKPEQSEIMMLDSATMQLSTFHDFGASDGSLTWVVRNASAWWCNFAFYGGDNAKTRLVRMDDAWRAEASWTYPPQVLAELGNYSISGGVWSGDDLLVTGHDHRRLYRLRLPATGSVLEFVEIIPAPFTGQGLAADPLTGGLIGIDRGKKRIVVAEFAPK